MLWGSSVAAQLATSQEALSYMSEWYNQAYKGRGGGEQKGQLPQALGLGGGGNIYFYVIKTLCKNVAMPFNWIIDLFIILGISSIFVSII
jgi:hypothetical protein